MGARKNVWMIERMYCSRKMEHYTKTERNWNITLYAHNAQPNVNGSRQSYRQISVCEKNDKPAVAKRQVALRLHPACRHRSAYRHTLDGHAATTVPLTDHKKARLHSEKNGVQFNRLSCVAENRKKKVVAEVQAAVESSLVANDITRDDQEPREPTRTQRRARQRDDCTSSNN